MRPPAWRAQIDRLLAPAESPPWSNRLVNGMLVTLVLVSVVAAVVETVEDLSPQDRRGSSAWSRRSPWR